jgi:hypothetical protein
MVCLKKPSHFCVGELKKRPILRKVFGPKKEKYQEDGENCEIRNFIIDISCSGGGECEDVYLLRYCAV